MTSTAHSQMYGTWTGSNFATLVDNPAETYLRLERRGEMVRAFYSHEGITWTEIGTHWIPPDFQVNAVGLTAAQDFNTPDQDLPADFDFFELSEGWGFLPEGFHDYDQGDVPSWACNAGGWATDPDDRATDLAVEISVDGVSLPEWLYAGEYREDLDDAGVCVDGYCGFSTSLWETISSYEPHIVVAHAQDIPSGEWVRLGNSPKTLTCRTYDIYAYAPLADRTQPLTDLRETDEYNPSWSPNGKKIVHDVVYPDGSQAVYITDLRTGVSAPLEGAENGGNDAVWSPNGKWIVFDRAWTDAPHLYVVPAVGGSPMQVRQSAMSADWAPNGKRVVFQDTQDGSIRTTVVNEGKGRETLIAARGANPAWSPDGAWIAYELDGDIWKVAVSIHGAVLGEPVRVTSLAAADGQPSWSPDSATIAFHSGLSQDYDLWTVAASGGEPVWLTGAPEFGDYDPGYARNSSTVAYASFSPEGQAARSWVAAYTHDAPPGSFDQGNHPYHFEFQWQQPEPGEWIGQGGEFDISASADLYEGYVLLRGPSELRGVMTPEGLACEEVGSINPDQSTRFLIGWLPDYGATTHAAAQAYFDSLAAKAVWDTGWAELVRHEVMPFREADWFNYVCTFAMASP